MFRDFCHTFLSCLNPNGARSADSVPPYADSVPYAWRGVPGPRRSRSKPAGAAIGQLLETRIMSAVVVQVDYSLDANGFFDDSARRTVLEDAINQISTRLDDTLLEIVPAGAYRACCAKTVKKFQADFKRTRTYRRRTSYCLEEAAGEACSDSAPRKHVSNAVK